MSTSSNGVGDALQLCHTAAKELQANASELSLRLARLEQDHLELVKRVEQASRELAAVSEQLSDAPKLADTPRRLADLQRTVADLGSRVSCVFGRNFEKIFIRGESLPVSSPVWAIVKMDRKNICS